MPIRAVLFDVGGPLDMEILHERLVDAHIREALGAYGVAVTDRQYAAAARWAVRVFAPDAYAAIIWRLAAFESNLAGEVAANFAARSPERSAARGGLELRPGINEALRDLHGRGLKLGLAANQPARAVHDLELLGLAGLFSYRQVSGHHGLRKPDVRLFLHACEDLEVAPPETIMVGDRIDNDIAPARMLGMRTVLFRTGRHVRQQPRSWDERPHAEVRSVDELRSALDSLIAASD